MVIGDVLLSNLKVIIENEEVLNSIVILFQNCMVHVVIINIRVNSVIDEYCDFETTLATLHF